MRGRIGKEDQADEQFQAGDVEVRARPVGKGDAGIGHLPRRDDRAGSVSPTDGNPGIGNEIEGQSGRLRILTKGQLVSMNARPSTINFTFWSKRYSNVLNTRPTSLA